MQYKLYYSGARGEIAGYLYGPDGEKVTTTTGLKDGKSARKWAREQANLHKTENTPEPVETESVSISGHKAFTL